MLEESERLLNEGGMVLEDAAVPGVRENAQLRIRQPAGELERVERRHHHVVIAIGDQHRLIFGKEITQITVKQVYQAVREVLSSSRTDNLRSL